MTSRAALWSRGAALVVAAMLFAGCSPGTQDASNTTPGEPNPTGEDTADSATTGEIDVTPLRQTHFDFEPANSPAELVEMAHHDALVRGRLRSVLPGGGLPPSEDDDSPEQYVVLDVEVEALYDLPSDTDVDQSVYVVLFQGSWRDGAPEYSVDDWNRALPSGTEMVLFLRKSNTGMVTGRHGIPADAVGMTPIPQGLVLRQGDGILGGLADLEAGWSELSWDALDEQLTRAAEPSPRPHE